MAGVISMIDSMMHSFSLKDNLLHKQETSVYGSENVLPWSVGETAGVTLKSPSFPFELKKCTKTIKNHKIQMYKIECKDHI